MWSHPFLKAALALYVAWGVWHWYARRPLHQPDGVLVAGEPEQQALPAGLSLTRGRWTLTPRATYRVSARVLSLEHYRFDAIAGLVPEDVVLGWGPMSDNRVLTDIELYQDHRFYFWRALRAMAITRESITSHSANTHLIPASHTVARQIARLRPGQVVQLLGTLVDARRDDGLTLDTSLSRTDQGAGACEVMLVTDVSP